MLGTQTVLTGEDSVYKSLLFVEVVDDWLSVVECGSCEDVDKEVLTHLLQKLMASWSDVESEIWIRTNSCFLRSVNESFVEVQHQEFSFLV